MSMNESYSGYEKLLRRAAKISDRYDENYRITGENFNLFQVLDVEEKEKFICKVLRELLSPSGSHYQRILFLKPFVKKILGLHDIPDNELMKAKVSREYYSTSKKRFIDLAIKTANYFIAIEVKINAGDSDKQCRDYYEEAKRHCPDENHAKIVYLTTDGREPAPNSASNKEIRISFEKDIHEWLEECLSYPEIEYAVSVREVMRQLLKTIQRFTNQIKENKKMELVELITKSHENFRSALELKNALPSAVENMRKKFLEAVIESLKSCSIEYEKLELKIENRSCAIQYHYEKLPNTVVCLGSEKKYTYVSYLFTGGDKAKPDFLARLKEYRGNYYNDEYNSKYPEYPEFFYWEHCRLDNGDSPNFFPDNPNEAMIELCDDEKFKEFVKLCAEKIKAFLDFSPENYN